MGYSVLGDIQLDDSGYIVGIHLSCNFCFTKHLHEYGRQ